MNTSNSEILAPAGNFKTAITAYNSGADAVYLGLQKFSARKSADNFDYIRLRRLKEFAKNNGKKIYVTINTLLTDSEFSDLAETLDMLSKIEVDAVIIQDYGVLKYIKDNFPELEVHASTQMAIHNVAGAKVAAELGFSRIVLSREVTAGEIINISKAVPEVELEVFIHGALCYSFSGLCLASGMMLERSGNRGECAQICRTYFEQEDKKSYPFSCNDLGLKEKVLELVDAGVASLKIEGRMKSPEYVSSVVNMYRNLIDKRTLFSELEMKSSLTFSRSNGEGFFRSTFGSSLINSSYSGHKGIEAGTVQKVDGNRVYIKTSFRFKSFDSISVFSDKGILRGGAQLKKFNVDRKDSSLMWLELPVANICEGDSVFVAGRSEKKLAELDEKSYPLFKSNIKVNVTLEKESISIKGANLELNSSFEIEEGRRPVDLAELFSSQLAKTGDASYKFVLEAIDNQTGLSNPFIPQSKVKALRRELSALVETEVAKYSSIAEERLNHSSCVFAKSRGNLFIDKSPFVLIDQLRTDTLPFNEETYYIPLMPLLFDEERYFSRVKELVRNNADKSFCIGINNIAHLGLAKELEELSNVRFFIDFYFYIANSNTIAFLNSSLSKIEFGYGWIEGSAIASLVDIEDKEVLPLFISRGCYKKHNLGQNCAGCSKSVTAKMTNMKHEFRVEVIDCVTYLFR